MGMNTTTTFTSPPYFDKERYFDEPGQCWRDHPTRESWLDGYLVPTLRAARSCKRAGAPVVVNIDEANRSAVLEAAARVGLEPRRELRLAHNRDHFAKVHGHGSTRHEPILVFT